MSGKKILLIGFIIVLLAAIPLTVYLVQQQQKARISAVAKTTLSFDPASKTVSVDETFNLDVKVDPGDTNQVSLVKFIINYDPAKLATSAAGATVCPANPTEAFCPNLSAFPNVMQGPIYEPGKISVTLSVGNDLSKAVKALATAGTVTFKALALTEAGNPTQVTYTDAPDTKVLSIGTNDQFNENVLLDRSPALITIIGEGPPVTETPSPTLSPTEGPTTTEEPTPTPTTEQTTTTGTTEQTVTAVGGPVCINLNVDPSLSGAAPYTVNFTANGQSNDSTISKVTFDFGDGQTQDVTQGGGIGSNSASVIQSHTYSSAGNYRATAVFTDAVGNVSPIGNCSAAIDVTGAIAQGPSPLPPTGPNNLVTIGSIGAVIALIGVVLLFAL